MCSSGPRTSAGCRVPAGVYAFSTDNLKRSETEVDVLFRPGNRGWTRWRRPARFTVTAASAAAGARASRTTLLARLGAKAAARRDGGDRGAQRWTGAHPPAMCFAHGAESEDAVAGSVWSAMARAEGVGGGNPGPAMIGRDGTARWRRCMRTARAVRFSRGRLTGAEPTTTNGREGDGQLMHGRTAGESKSRLTRQVDETT